MFSTAQQSYINAIIPTYAKEGYKYYVCYTNTVVNSGYYGSAEPDLYALFSKAPISAKDAYSFSLEDSAVLVAVRSGNYSSSSSAVNTDRVSASEYTQSTLTVDEYEHIYTNAEFEGITLQPDYNLISGGETNVRLESITFIMLVALFLAGAKLLFRRR